MKKRELRKLLGLVNKMRGAWNLPPLASLPKGNRGRQTSCPLANSIPVRAMKGHSAVLFAKDYNNAELLDKLEAIPGCSYFDGELDLPYIFLDFVIDFDAGKHPELVE